MIGNVDLNIYCSITMLNAWGSVRGAMCLSPACAPAGRLARWLSTEEGSKREEDAKGDGPDKEQAQGLSAAQMAKVGGAEL